MSSDEEYLDDLLKSIVEDEEESEHLNAESASLDAKSQEVQSLDDLGIAIEDTDGMGSDDLGIEDLEAVLGEMETEEIAGEAVDDMGIEDIGIDGEPMGDMAIADIATDDLAIEDIVRDDALMDDLAIEDIGNDEMFADEVAADDMTLNHIQPEEEAVNDFAIEDFEVVEPEEGELEEEEESLISDDEVDAMFAAADAAAMEEAKEIKVETEEDMLALLDSMSNEIEAENAAAQQAAAEVADTKRVSGEEESNEKGKKKKKRFGSKKKVDKEQTVEDGFGGDAGEDGAALEETAKKPNFFSKVIAFLTESDEEEEELKDEHGLEPSDENKSILEELDKEDKKKKKKGKKGKEEEAGEEGEGGEEEGKGGKKEKKKKKKEKKEKAAAADILETEPAKPAKKISKKNVAVIAGLCLTFTAMIVVLCSIVPGFFDKREARDAYYQLDYAKSYELLYGKKLDNSDTIIYNKSKIIVEMNRKLEAYHNYLAIGEDVRALDALMAGIQKYPDILLEAEEYYVTQEVDAIYETMLNILNDKYDISESMAKVIIDYDDLTYTKKLESIVNGTPFADPSAEVWTSPDILSEERDFLDNTADNVLGESSAMDGTVNADASADTIMLENTLEELTANTEGEITAAEMPKTSITPEDTNSETAYIPEESVSAETSVSEENDLGTAGTTDNSSGSQGQMIQGIRQPIDIQIHGR